MSLYLSEGGFLPCLVQLLLQVGPDSHLDVHHTGRAELTQQVLQLYIAWCCVKEFNMPRTTTATCPVQGQWSIQNMGKNMFCTSLAETCPA